MGVEIHLAVNNSYVRTNSHVVLYSIRAACFASCSLIPNNKMGVDIYSAVNNLYVRTKSHVVLFSKCAACFASCSFIPNNR